MNLPSDTPKLPKWIFLLGDAVLVAAAFLIYSRANSPANGPALIATVTCVVAAVVIGVIPFVADYARRQDEALDNRQRSLQALASTLAAAAEQVSIAAVGLQGIAEAAQENFSKSERLSGEIQGRIAALDARLAASGKDDGEAAARLEAVARKIGKTAAEFEAAAIRAAEAARALPVPPVHIPELPPVIASRIVEIRPAVPVETAHEAPPLPAPAEPAAAADAGPPSPASAPPEIILSEAPPQPAPRKRAPRKAAPPVETPQPAPVLEASPAEEAPAAQPAEIAEPALSSDGATRLVVTAYIGIGNRLFIRGEGAGLSWDKGVPLTFVSIGKWRWETNDAAGAVRFKLYKNDETECTSLGERSAGPGSQVELTASF